MIDVGLLPLKGQLSLTNATASELIYLWMLGGNLATLTITAEGVTLATDASPEQVAMLEAALRGDEPAWHAPARILFNRVLPLVGTPVIDWTAADFMKVVTLLLLDKKALDNNLKLRHPREWVKRRPSDAA